MQEELRLFICQGIMGREVSADVVLLQLGREIRVGVARAQQLV